MYSRNPPMPKEVCFTSPAASALHPVATRVLHLQAKILMDFGREGH
jgi:hypothetical protein